MTTSRVRFAQLRHLLLDLHFRETKSKTAWRFEHPASGAVFLFRPYAVDDQVSEQDLGSTRTHLEWRGLLLGSVFDNSLAKTPA